MIESRHQTQPSTHTADPPSNAQRLAATHRGAIGLASSPHNNRTADLLTLESYRPTNPTPAAWQRYHLTRLDAALAVAFFLTALLVCWPFIQRGETLLHSDEAVVGIMAQDIAAGRSLPIYFYGQRYMGALEAYAVAALSPLFDNPIYALRFGPACFFALMVAIQYLMLSRWFSRRGGLVGAAALLAASPMFMQWSISARGGYVEILLWGSALLWAYSEWFVPPTPQNHPMRHRFCFGAIIGSGLWINPSIVLFVLPVAAHALLHRPLANLWNAPHLADPLGRLSRRTGRATLSLALLLAVVLLNLVWSVWVGEDGVHSVLFLGLLPKPAAIAVVGLLGIGTLILVATRTNLLPQARKLAADNAAIILGTLAGAAPAVLYLLQTTLGARVMDPSLPLGLRPLWLAGDNLLYLFGGLPLLFGADPRPFLQLVTVGYDNVTRPLDLLTSGLAAGADWLLLGAGLSALLVILTSERDGLSRLLRLRPTNHSPATLLLLGIAVTLGLYLLSGCAVDFTSIRYLVPLWVFVPGLMAAVFVNRRFPLAAKLAPLCACLAWAVGQIAMHGQLGAAHPLHAVADALVAHGIDPAVAETIDAHDLSYLSQQRCRTIEFQPFIQRLGRYASLTKPDAPVNYIVRPNEIDRSLNWARAGWPGRGPPETLRHLWPRLRRTLIDHPDWLLTRRPLADGYECFRLRHPLPQRSRP